MKSLKDEFIEILSNYQGILYKVSLIYFKNRADIEDNFQEIAYQLWRSYPKLKNKSSVGSWIYAISINTSLSHLKSSSRLEYREKIPAIADNKDFLKDILSDESSRILINAIYELDEANRSIMLLYLEEKSYDEIAEIIGITKSNVGVRINRAKRTLKDKLKML